MLLPVLFSSVFLGNFTQQNLSGSSAISLYLGGGYPSLKKKKDEDFIFVLELSDQESSTSLLPCVHSNRLAYTLLLVFRPHGFSSRLLCHTGERWIKSGATFFFGGGWGLGGSYEAVAMPNPWEK